jgi:arginyl-tRNA synthetase
MRDREGNIVFNWDTALNLEGRSGPYIQYAYVRSKKLNAQLNLDSNEAKEIPTGEFGLTEHDKALIKVLIRMDEAIDEVIKTHKPHHLALYCYDLATTFNSFYALSPSIIGETIADLKLIRSVLSKMTEEKLKI